MSLKYYVMRKPKQYLMYVRHGIIHRKTETAFVSDTFQRSWLEYGKNHRIGGPAIINTFDCEFYYIRGVEYTKEEYESKIRSKYNR